PVLARASDEIQRLVSDLGSADFAVRQEASGRLAEAGSQAIGPLAAAATSADAEVRNRAQLILLNLARSPKADVRERSMKSIRELSRSSVPRVAQVARAMLAKIHEGASAAAPA